MVYRQASQSARCSALRSRSCSGCSWCSLLGPVSASAVTQPMVTCPAARPPRRLSPGQPARLHHCGRGQHHAAELAHPDGERGVEWYAHGGHPGCRRAAWMLRSVPGACSLTPAFVEPLGRRRPVGERAGSVTQCWLHVLACSPAECPTTRLCRAGLAGITLLPRNGQELPHHPVEGVGCLQLW